MATYTDRSLFVNPAGVVIRPTTGDFIESNSNWRTIGSGTFQFNSSGAVSFGGNPTVNTGTGALTIGGTTLHNAAVTMGANFGISANAGTGAFDLSAASGEFKTPTGINTIGGNIAVPASSTKTYDFSNSSGIFSTSTGTNTLKGSTVLSQGKSLTVEAGGAGAVDFSNSSGIFKTSTGVTTIGGVTTFSAAGDAVVITNNLKVGGNLVVAGTTISAQTEVVNVADNHLFLNSDYAVNSAQAGGIVVNYLPSATNQAVAAGGFNTTSTVKVGATAGFVANDLILITGATNPANNGLFSVASVQLNDTITIKTAGTAGENYYQNIFDSVNQGSIAGNVRKVSVSIIRSGTDGIWESAAGDTDQMVFADLISSTTLQQAYNNSTSPATITTAGSKNIQFTLTSGGFTVLGTGQVDMGADATIQTLNFGTGGAAKTVSVGSSNGTSSLTLEAGTGALNIGTSAFAKAITVGNVTGATAVAINAGTGASAWTVTGAGTLSLVAGAGAVALASNATDHATTMGSTTVASPTDIRSGTSAMTFTAGGAFDVNAVGAVTLDSSGSTIGIGTDAVNQAISIGTGGNRAITLGNATAGTSLTLNSNGNIDIGTGAQARTVNVGTGAAVQTVTLGSQNGASVTNINAGTGHLTMQVLGAGAQMRFGMADNVSGAFSIANGGGNNYVNISTSDGAPQIDIGLSADKPAINIRGGNIVIDQAVSLAATPGYTVDFLGGAAGNASAGSNAGNAGNFNITSGNGGAGLSQATPRNAGFAGNLNITGGVGGAGAASADAPAHGVNGGNVTIKGGVGGAGAGGAGGNANAGLGGSLLLAGGAGGAGGAGNGGNANGVEIRGGVGGTGGVAGNAGVITIGNTDTLSVAIASANNRGITIGHSGNTQAATFRGGSGGIAIEVTGNDLNLKTLTSGNIIAASAGNITVSQLAPTGTGGLIGSSMTWTGANGGLGSTTGPVAAGAGGNWSLTSGAGGAATAGGTPSAAGVGGPLAITGGAGGAAATSVNGGTGANLTIVGGAGGVGATTATSGQGGVLALKAGAAGTAGAGTQGVGGNLVLEAGQGNAHGNIQIGLTNTSAIQIGTDGNPHTITMGTGAAAMTVTVGSGNSTSSTVIDCGTGNLTLGTTANQHNVTIGSITGTSTVTVQSGTGGVIVATPDNTAIAFQVKEGTNAIVTVDTTNNVEKVVIGAFLDISRSSGVTLTAAENLAANDIVAFDQGNTPARAQKANANGAGRKVPFAISSDAPNAAATGRFVTVPGSLVAVGFTGTNPVQADCGSPVYLSEVSGKAILVPEQSVGSQTWRLGILASANGTATATVLWMPAFVAQN